VSINPTASTFREPLLRALGTKTGLVADTSVPMSDVLPLVYAETGYTEEQFGSDPHGHPMVRLWVQQAYNKLLGKQDLTAKAGRGQWALNAAGVQVAAALLRKPVPTQVSSPLAVHEAVPAEDEQGISFDDLLDTVTGSAAPPAGVPEPIAAAPVVVTSMHEGGGGVSWSLGSQVNTYNSDPYIRGLAVEATRCFGEFSPRSDVCKTCPLSGACKAVVFTRAAELAVTFRKRDEEAAKRAAQPTAVTPPEEVDDITDIISAIKDEVEGASAKPTKPVADGSTTMTIPTDAKCKACGQKIPRGTDCSFVRGEGAYHNECYKGK
jgi:hypothetical protein